MKPRLTNSDYCRSSNRLGCEVAAIKAVAEQESLGSGFDSQDRPKILFERHIFHRLTKGKYDSTHPGISNPNQGGYGSSASQYGRFSEAFALNQAAAMMATSWGKFQILGANFAICGFLTVGEFVDAMKESEGRQLDAFCEFVLHNHLDGELTDHNWAGFARGYNGPSYRKNKYDVKIAAGYKKFSKEKIDCGQVTNPPDVPAPDTSDGNGALPNDSENSADVPPVDTPQPLVQDTPVVVAPESPSLFTKIGAAFTAVAGFGLNLGSLVQTKLEAMSVQQIVYMIAALGLVGGAILWYRHSAALAQARTLALINKAADPTQNTVALVAPK